MEFFELLIIFCLSFNSVFHCFKKFPWKIINTSNNIFVSWDFKLLQVSIILDFIQNLKSSVKIHLKPQWVRSFSGRHSF